MTAEIAVFNKIAVALAADSAVTILNGQKIYNSANKLFSLSKYNPIGVMIYGSAEIMGVPWETVIKLYRKKLGEQAFQTVKLQVADFLKFLKDSRDLFPESEQKKWYQFRIAAELRFLKQGIDSKLEEFFKVKGKLDETEVQALIQAEIQARMALAEGVANLQSLPADFVTTFQRNYEATIDEAIGAIFQAPSLSAENLTMLRKFCAVIESKDLIADSSGVVIAGFGADEIFPACETHMIDAISDSHLRYKRENGQCVEIGRDNNASIVPFAQREIVDTFIRGMDPRYYKVVSSFLTNVLEKYPEIIGGAITDPAEKSKALDTLKAQAPEIMASFDKEMAAYSQQANWGPIINAVAALSKDDLASMAESLVSLTSFKRKVSMGEKETVGGPIDVAVISKGDGFIWIKRKHYFQTELNQHFMRNYYRKEN